MNPSKPATASLRQGVLDTLPIAVSYVPFGAIFGMLSLKAGLTVWQSVAMSLVVYAGASQFTAVSMISEQAGIWAIVLTTFLLNARHLLMALSLAPHYRSFSRAQLNGLGFFLTDELYALVLNRVRSGMCDARYVLASSLTLYLAWCTGTWAGTTAGQWLPDPEMLGLGFSFTAMFLALAYYQLTSVPRVLTFLACGAAAVSLALVLPAGLHLVAVGLFAFLVGYLSPTQEAANSEEAPREVETA